MESQVKALKVADLKEILKKASVTVPPGAKKAGLIAKILAEPAAVDVYNALYNPTEVTLQHDASSQSKPNASGKSPVQDPAPPPKPASTTTFTATPEATTAVENAELAKRQARAARFGIPLVEPEKQLPDQEQRLKMRVERFGTGTTSKVDGQSRKRGPPEEIVSPEELERRKKRAERFGVPLAGTSKA